MREIRLKIAERVVFKSFFYKTPCSAFVAYSEARREYVCVLAVITLSRVLRHIIRQKLFIGRRVKPLKIKRFFAVIKKRVNGFFNAFGKILNVGFQSAFAQLTENFLSRFEHCKKVNVKARLSKRLRRVMK